MVRRYVYPGSASFVVGGRCHDEVIGPEYEPAAARLFGHPQKGDFREPGLGVAAADVAVDACEPDLLERLVPGVVLLDPERRHERAAPLVDRERLVGVEHVC